MYEWVAHMYQAPELAVDSRVRPTHYKPQVEREMEEIASVPAFKAQPVKCGPITLSLMPLMSYPSTTALQPPQREHRATGHLELVFLP